MRITPSRSVEHAVVVPRDEKHEDGQGLRAVRDLADHVEARLVPPVHPLDDEDEGASEGERREQVAQTREDALLARVGVFVATAEVLVASSARRITTGLAGSPPAAAPPARAISRDHLGERLLARRADGAPNEVGDRRVRTSIVTGVHSTWRSLACGAISARNVATRAVLPMPISPMTARHTS